jgi:hypothetical protein
MSNTDARQWEYLVSSVSATMPDAARTIWLDEQGAQGWELVSETSVVDGYAARSRFTFKRPKEHG